jgi:hypothetical protein
MGGYAQPLSNSDAPADIKRIVIKYLYGGHISANQSNWLLLYQLAREIHLDCLEKDLLKCASDLNARKLLIMANADRMSNLYDLFMVAARQFPLDAWTYAILHDLHDKHLYLSKYTEDKHIDHLCFELTIRGQFNKKMHKDYMKA